MHRHLLKNKKRPALPEETVKIIGLACFKTQEEAEQMPVNELFDVVFELIGNERVIDFFTKFMK